MADNNNFQVCADLSIENKYAELRAQGEDALALIFNMQKSIQTDVYGYDWEKIRETVGDLKAFLDWNEEAIRDEYRELAGAVTGIHTYPGHWKPWKTKHKEAMQRKFDELTEDEKKELRMEWIDILHFFMNQGIAIGMTPEMITNYYVAKNARNISRQRQIGGY
jgi:hypothetical protein